MALPTGYKTTAQCWQEYPKLPFPESVGARGTAQKRARDACIAASMKGQADPELATGPAILRDLAALWRSPEPWNERPTDVAGRVARVVGRVVDPGDLLGGIKTDGDVLRSQAVGWRPAPDGRFQDIERKATIRGGIDALSSVGIYPWVQISQGLANVKGLQLKNDTTSSALLGLVQNAAAALGKPQPRTMKDAAEFVRSAVNIARLEKPAWLARGVHLAMAGIRGQKQRQGVETAVASTLGVASLATAAIPPVAIILQAASWAYTIAGARTAAEQTRNEALAQKYTTQFGTELRIRDAQLKQEALEAELQQLKRAVATSPADLASAHNTALVVQGLVWAGVIGTSAGLIWLALRPSSNRK